MFDVYWWNDEQLMEQLYTEEMVEFMDSWMDVKKKISRDILHRKALQIIDQRYRYMVSYDALDKFIIYEDYNCEVPYRIGIICKKIEELIGKEYYQRMLNYYDSVHKRHWKLCNKEGLDKERVNEKCKTFNFVKKIRRKYNEDLNFRNEIRPYLCNQY